jgi:PAS domain S-box-containing protein
VIAFTSRKEKHTTSRTKAPPKNAKTGPDIFRSLRQKAEKKLKNTKTALPDGREASDLRANMHELQVHQIELEMQNDELLRAKGELENSEQKFRDLYDFAPVGYATIDTSGSICELNLAGASLLGEARIRIVRKRFQVVLPPESVPVFNDFSWRVFSTNSRQTAVIRLRNSGEFPRYIQIEGRVIETFGEKTSRFRAAFFDITDRISAEQALRENEEILKQSINEKEVLLAEVHHRVKNNLAALISLISLGGSSEDSPEGQRLKQDLQNRIMSMALIHETLYKTRMYSSVDMGVYLRTLINQIAGSSLRARPEKIIVSVNGIDLDLARATPCGLITTEILTNSLKYAFPDPFDCEKIRGAPCTIEISLTKVDGTYTLSVKDNGIGLPPELDLQNMHTLGLKLVNFLARHQLRATIEVLRDYGTEFRFRFKDPLNYKERS